ncbi:MAG: PQQ-binding-like beta-propeller repeat protein [Planctomycetes bacterium]|nr:PQQ-binding-like beta-propeller repeat protein [Planctomycetota bacterium]
MMNRCPTRPWPLRSQLTISLYFALAAALVPTAYAQGWRERRGPAEYFTSDIQVSSSRIAEEKLDQARKDLETGEYSRAVRLLQEVIDDHGTRAVRDGAGLHVSLRAHCMRFLRSLPPEGMTIYRKIFDPYARELFERGVREHDLRVLRDLVFRYQETSYGQQGLLTSLSLALAAGEFTNAFGLGLLYLDAWPDGEDAPRVLASLGLAARRMHQSGTLRERMTRIPAAQLDARLDIGGENMSLRQWLDRCLAAADDDTQGESPRFGVMDFRTPRWTRSLELRPFSSPVGTDLHEFGSPAGQESDYLWHPVAPVLDAGAVYLSNGVSVEALTLFSGDLKWTVPGNVRPAKSQARPNLSLEFPIVLHGNVLYVPLETPVPAPRMLWSFVPHPTVAHRRLCAIDASSGRVIWNHDDRDFARDEPETRELVRSFNIATRPLVVGDEIYVSATRFLTSYQHYVCCFDRHTGALRWATFVCTGQMEQNMFGNRVREAVPGELTLIDGRLVYSTNMGAIASVDARLGTVDFVVEYEQSPIPRQLRFDANIHERAPGWANNSPIQVGSEVLLAPTDSDHLYAVNRFTGELRETGIRRDARNRFRYIVGVGDDLVVVLGASVLFYEPGTRRIEDPKYDFGSSVRRRGRAGGYDAGIQGRPVVVGRRLVATVRDRDTDKFAVWDLEQRRLVEELPIARGRDRVDVLANLAAADGVFVAVAADQRRRKTAEITCYFDPARVAQRLRASVAAAPDDPELRLRIGEFALQGASPDPKAALEAFTQAYDLASRPGGEPAWRERARNALYRLYVELASEPLLARSSLGLDDTDCYERAFNYAGDRGQKVSILFRLLARAMDQSDLAAVARHEHRIVQEYAEDVHQDGGLFSSLLPELGNETRRAPAALLATLAVASWHERAGRGKEALQRYETVLRRFGHESLGEQDAWSVAHDHLTRLLASAGPEIYADSEREARKLYEAGLADEGLARLEQVLVWYPKATVVTDAWLAISRRLIAEGRHAEALERIHEFFWRFGTITPGALTDLANALEAQGCSDSARQVWRYSEDFATANASDESVAFLELARQRLASLGVESRVTASALPEFGVQPKLVQERGRADADKDWVLVEPRGRRPATMKNRFLVHRAETLLCLTTESEDVLWQRPCAAFPYMDLIWFDGRLIGVLDAELVCLDPAKGQVLWRGEVPEHEILTVTCSHGRVLLLARPSGYGAAFRLQARSILDGAVVFEVPVEGDPITDRIHVSHRWIMLVLQDRPARARVLDALTGRPAPAFPNGISWSESKIPHFADNGAVILVEGDPSGSERLVAIDPESGRHRWKRPLERGRRVFAHEDPFSVIYRSTEGRSHSLTMIDLLQGTALFSRTFPNAIEPYQHGINVGPDAVYYVCKESTPQGLRLHVESIDLASGSLRWKGVPLEVFSVSVDAFEGGCIMRAAERLKAPGRSGDRNKNTLYFLDDRTGRVRSQFELTQRRQAYYTNISTFVDGKLVLSDGPLLKVLEP